MRFNAACSLSLATALLALAVQAEPSRDDAPLSLKALMDGMAKSSGVIADFHETKQIALLAKPLESSGVLYFVPPDRLARFTLEPEASALIIDGGKLRFQQGEHEQFDLSANPMARIFIDNFIVLFNGDLQKLQQLYRTDFSADGERWSLDLEPRGRELSRVVKEIALRGDHTGIREMVMQNRDGDRTSTALDVIETHYAFTSEQLQALFVEGTRPATPAIR